MGWEIEELCKLVKIQPEILEAVFKVIASPQFRKLIIRSASYRKRKMDEGIGTLERLQRENRELREEVNRLRKDCLLYTSPSPRD